MTKLLFVHIYDLGSVAFSIVVLSCYYQGKFRLRKKKPEQQGNDKVANNQADQPGSTATKLKPGKEQEEDLPDLKDPEVQKATTLIQVLNYSSTNMPIKVSCTKKCQGNE